MRLLKFRHDLPFHLEHRLTTVLGWAVSKRQLNEWILFSKSDADAKLSLHERLEAIKKTKEAEAKKAEEPPKQLSLAEIDDLTKRMLNIVNCFADPSNHVGPIRARLFGMSQTCHRTEERVFIKEWMDEKFPEPYRIPSSVAKLAVIEKEETPVVIQSVPAVEGQMPRFDQIIKGKFWNTLPPGNVCKELETRCDRISAQFQDPYNNILLIRQRLYNMAINLATVPERQYVQDYMDDNFPLEAA